MIRILALILLTVGFMFILLWAKDNPGQVRVQWLGVEAATSVPFLIAVVILLAVLLTLMERMTASALDLPRRWARWRMRRRYVRGHSALSRGLVAVAAGDSGRARKEAARAGDLLQDESLVLLLSAQAAQLDGNEAAARKQFTEMAARADTAFLGIRGLLGMALRNGDETDALELARRAFDLQNSTPWVLQILFDLQVRHGLWKEAQTTLGRATKLGVVATGEANRKTAVLLVQRAEQAVGQDRREDALRLLQEAHAKAPTLLPVVLRYTEALIDNGNHRKAAKLIEQAWVDGPAPDLAARYARARPIDDKSAALKAMQRLAKSRPDHPESHLAIAEAAIAARQWVEARTQLRAAAEQEPAPSARLCTLMARLEESENGDTGAARDWLLRASAARSFTVWECRQCGAVSQIWTALCDECGAFDSLMAETVRPAMRSEDALPPTPRIEDSVSVRIAEAARSAATAVDAMEQSSARAS